MALEGAALPVEPWGWRLKRVREKHLDLTIGEVVERLGRYMLTSSAAVSRLEALDEPPTGRRARALAAALVYIYGLDPRPFDVGRDDLPPAIYADLSRLPGSNRDDGGALTRRYVRGQAPVAA